MEDPRSRREEPVYSTRFKQWRFYAMIAFALADLATPFVSFTALTILGFSFIPRFEDRVAKFLVRSLYGRYYD